MVQQRHVTSAGVLLHGRHPEGHPVVFLAHPGGPFWVRRDAGAWSIPKGEYDALTEDPWLAAQREFVEEIGVPVPPGVPLDLGEAIQPSRKRVRTFAVEVADPAAVTFVGSNIFELEWPKGSGRIRQFPEIDRAEWFDLATARVKVLTGQLPIIEELAARQAWRI